MNEEIRLETTYQVVRFLLKLVDCHVEILNQELEAKARKEEEIAEELECYSNLRMRLLLYLGRYTKVLEVGLNENDIIFLDKICYLYFIVTNKIIKSDKRLMKELEQLHRELKEIINMRVIAIGQLN